MRHMRGWCQGREREKEASLEGEGEGKGGEAAAATVRSQPNDLNWPIYIQQMSAYNAARTPR
jgi:hypothetical protein